MHHRARQSHHAAGYPPAQLLDPDRMDASIAEMLDPIVRGTKAETVTAAEIGNKSGLTVAIFVIRVALLENHGTNGVCEEMIAGSASNKSAEMIYTATRAMILLVVSALPNPLTNG